MTSDVSISKYLTAPYATVSVGLPEALPNVVVMTWQQIVQVGDVTAAFGHINSVLESCDEGLYVIVDILSQPKFPMSETIYSAVRGPYRHPRLNTWLIVGENRLARMIEAVVANLTGRKNVEWFESMQAALAYLGKQSEETA